VRQKFLAPVLPSQTVQVECVPTGSDRLPTEVACRFVNQDGVLVAKADLVVEFSS
jgi:acyl-CoA thioesterase FadM